MKEQKLKILILPLMSKSVATSLPSNSSGYLHLFKIKFMGKKYFFISFSRIGNNCFCTEINRPKSYRTDGENDFEEKNFKLNQYNDDITATGPITKDADKSWSSSCRETRVLF